MSARVLCFCLAISLCGSTSFALDLSAGIRGGGVANLFWGGFVDELETQMQSRGAEQVAKQAYFSYRAAAFLRLEVLEFLGFQAELGFGPSGGSLLSTEGLSLQIGVSGYLIDIPLLAVGSIDTRLGTVTLSAGPLLDIAAGSPLLIQNDGFIRSEITLAPYSELCPTFGLVGGAGFEIPFGSGFIIVDTRFRWGITSLLDTDETDAGDLKLSSIELTAGYRFKLPLKRKTE